MVTPFEILGLPHDATIEQAETAYRAGLRNWHPDLHQSRGPAAVADAEAHTRALNDAIGAVRAGWRPAPFGGAAPSRASGPAGGATSARCPLCSSSFVDLPTYENHLLDVHHVRDPRVPRAGLGIVDTLGKLRYIPAWLPALLSIGAFIYLPIAFIPLWVVLALVLWAQTSPRFKARRWRPPSQQRRPYG